MNKKDQLILERWQVLAGIDKNEPEQINEESLAGRLALKIDSGEIKTEEELTKAAKGLFGGSRLTSDEISTLVSMLPKEGQKPKSAEELKKEIEEAIPEAKAEAQPEEKPSSEDGDKPKPAEEAGGILTKFSKAVADIKSSIGEDVTDQQLSSVLQYLDELESIKIVQ